MILLRLGIMLALVRCAKTVPIRSGFAALSTEYKRRPRVLLPVADGTEELEAVTIADTLVRGGIRVTIASVPDASGTASLQVVCSRGVKLFADKMINDCVAAEWDMIVLPGGVKGATVFQNSVTLTDMVKKQVKENKPLGAICASPALVLAHHKLITTHTATCYPSEAFKSTIPNFMDQKVVVDGNLITSQGPGTAVSFALSIVELLCDKATADRVAEEMLFTR